MDALNQTNDENNGDNQEEDNVINIIFVAAYIVIIMFSLAGNSIVIHLVRTRSDIRQNPFNWLLANTAVADVLDVLTASSFTMSFFIAGNRWIPGIVGALLCKLIPFILKISISVAVWTLTVIAVDRFLAIVCIRRRPMSSRAVVRSVFCLWLCFSVIFCGQLYTSKTRETEDGTVECIEDWHDFPNISHILFRAELVFKLVITYAIPLTIMTILYSLIACFLWRHKPPGHVNQQAYAKQAKKRRAVIKMLLAAVSVFTICWLPVHVGHMMSVFHTNAYEDIPIVFRLFFFWLAHANAAIHPWLFIVFSEKLRVETKLMFPRFTKHRPRKQDRFKLPALSTFSQQTLGNSSLELRASRYLQTSVSSTGISNLSLDTRFWTEVHHGICTISKQCKLKAYH